MCGLYSHYLTQKNVLQCNRCLYIHLSVHSLQSLFCSFAKFSPLFQGQYTSVIAHNSFLTGTCTSIVCTQYRYNQDCTRVYSCTYKYMYIHEYGNNNNNNNIIIQYVLATLHEPVHVHIYTCTCMPTCIAVFPTVYLKQGGPPGLTLG